MTPGRGAVPRRGSLGRGGTPARGRGRARGLVCAVDSDATNGLHHADGALLNPDLFIVARASERGSDKRLLQGRGRPRGVAVREQRPPHGARGPATARTDVLEVESPARCSMKLEEVQIDAGSTMTGKSVDEALGSHPVLAIRHAAGQITANPPLEHKLQAGDLVLMLGEDELSAVRRSSDRSLPTRPSEPLAGQARSVAGANGLPPLAGSTSWPRIFFFWFWNSASVRTPLSRRSARRSSSVVTEGAAGAGGALGAAGAGGSYGPGTSAPCSARPAGRSSAARARGSGCSRTRCVRTHSRLDDQVARSDDPLEDALLEPHIVDRLEGDLHRAFSR